VPKARSCYDLKKAINNAKKCHVYTVFGRTKDGTQLGGYVEAYKSHLKEMMKTFQLPTTSWDKTVECFFRVDDDGDLYIEGFNAN
jgi:putative IMPACT (imprinted ancient) family translation regulator